MKMGLICSEKNTKSKYGLSKHKVWIGTYVSTNTKIQIDWRGQIGLGMDCLATAFIKYLHPSQKLVPI